MDDKHSRRSSSPYHEKCFPPYCDNAQQVDKAMVSKMPRGDLEDKYITFADENLELKKQNKNLEKQVQRLQTAIQRQDRLDKRAGYTPTSMVADGNKVASLEAQNRNLQAKIKVLKQQLINHSYIHCKDSRLSDAKMRAATGNKTPREFDFPCESKISPTQSARDTKPDKNLAALKQRIADLENQLETQKNKYKGRIAQLEKELSALEKEAAKSGTSVNEQLSETSRQVKDNTELIKLRRQAEQQAAELEGLRERLVAADGDVDKLKEQVKEARDRADDLEQQLEKERNKSRTALSEASKGTTNMEAIRALEEQIRDLQNERDTLKDTNEKLLELTQTKSEKSLRTPSGHSTKDTALDELKKKAEELENQLADANNELDTLRPLAAEHENDTALDELKKKAEELENQLADANNELDTLRPIAAEHENCPKGPIHHTSSSQEDLLRKENEKLEEELKEAKQALEDLRPIAEEHKQSCMKPVASTTCKSVQAVLSPISVQKSTTPAVSFHDGPPKEIDSIGSFHPSEDSVHSKRTIDSERYIALSRQLQEALEENEQLRKKLRDLDGSESLRRQNDKLEDQLNKALQELREVMPIVHDHTKNCTNKEHKEYLDKSSPPSVKSKPSPVHSVRVSPVHSVRDDYVSHVTPPPSIHCAETVDINDPAQKANLLIVSQHDFETVLMQKKRYSTEVEIVEPVDGRQTLNCKLEICMYDLDIEDRMMEYLRSLQPEPKVYVEWSFVGLNQRTAPLPAEQALFYTNVMYYGPLSNEIKSYLDKVEMPVDLYLVRSQAAPLKVAEGTMDLLPAIEQPNRGFMRSIFLRGKDLPSRFASDRAVATIHSSFILHECCMGDPPFKDQVEVGIGTLYLKNRDGGVVPDHATHIYIEYALLGHCGPDLETDSVPRGEVMKFNHSKKLRVNEENSPHLRPMLADDNTRPLRFTVLMEPCSLASESEVETVGHADINLNEEMIKKDKDLISSQVPVFSNEGEHLGTLSVTVLGIGTLQDVYKGTQLST